MKIKTSSNLPVHSDAPKSARQRRVVSTTKSAVELWKKLGFSIVGTIPRAFKH